MSTFRGVKKRTYRWMTLGLAAGLILAGFVWVERGTRPAEVSEPRTGVRQADTSSGAGQPIQARTPGDAAPAERVSDVAASSDAVASASAEMSQEDAASSSSELPTSGDILSLPDEDHVRVAKKLAAIALDPRQPMAEREDALAHTLNLSAGNEEKVLTPLVKDPALPDDLAETILSEALNRSLDYQADLYLEALATRKTPELQAKIREHLAFLTGGEDKGSDPAAWKPAIEAAKASWPR